MKWEINLPESDFKGMARYFYNMGKQDAPKYFFEEKLEEYIFKKKQRSTRLKK